LFSVGNFAMTRLMYYCWCCYCCSTHWSNFVDVCVQLIRQSLSAKILSRWSQIFRHQLDSYCRPTTRTLTNLNCCLGMQTRSVTASRHCLTGLTMTTSSELFSAMQCETIKCLLELKKRVFLKAQPSGFYWVFWTSRKNRQIIQKLSNLKP